MPLQLPGNYGRADADMTVIHKDLGYKYPRSDGKRLNFLPESELTEKLKNEILRNSDEAFYFRKNRFPVCRELDQVLTAYVPLKAWEEAKKAKDPRRPVAAVVPFSATNLDTLMTYMCEVFFGMPPMFQYEGVGPEDTVGAKLLELKVQMDVSRAKIALPAQYAMRDGLTYGAGYSVPDWEVIEAPKSKWTIQDVINLIGDITGQRKVDMNARNIIYEGNALKLIDFYRAMPDPHVAAWDIQRGEFFNYSEIANILNLKRDEMKEGSTLFNVDYLEKMGGNMMTRYTPDQSGRVETRMGSLYRAQSTKYTTLVNSYKKIIPAQWGLGKSERVEQWFFTLADGEIFIDAKPVGLDHGRFPVCVNVPDGDGYSPTPVGRIELGYGLQVGANFNLNTWMENTIRSMQNLFLLDPSAVNIDDILNPVPAGIIRIAEERWGTDVREVFSQLKIENVTSQNIQTLPILSEMIEKSSAATDIVQGLMRSGRGDRSATESQNLQNNAMNRLKRLAMNTSLTMMQDLGMFFAYHTQQFMKQPMYVRELGDWPEALQAEMGERKEAYGAEGLRFGRDDFNVTFDVTPHDGAQPIDPGGKAKTAIDMMQMLSGFNQHPQFGQVNLLGMITRIGRILGFKDFYKFVNTAQVQTMPDDQVRREHEAGNLARPDELPGGMPPQQLEGGMVQ